MKQPEKKQISHERKGKLNKAKSPKLDNNFRLSKPYRQIAWQLNKAYDEVRNEGIWSNSINLFEQTLEAFYDKYDLKVANTHHISMQKQMPEEAVEELAKIALRFADIATEDRNFFYEDLTKGLSKRDKEIIQQKQQEAIVNGDENIDVDGIEMPWDKFDVDRYKKIQDKYGVETVQDFINWTDEMERFRGEAFLLSVLSSHQIADIFSYAIDAQKENQLADLSFDAISKMAYREYKNNGGITGEKLRTAIYERISRASRSR